MSVTMVSPWIAGSFDLMRAWEADARTLATYLQFLTFAGVGWTLWKLWKSRWLMTVVAVNADRESEREVIARVPAHMASRSEILGLVSKHAGPTRLDFSQFRYDYKFRREVEVRLPESSFQHLRERPRPPTSEC